MPYSHTNSRRSFASWLEKNKRAEVASDIKLSIGTLDLLLMKSCVIRTHIFKIDSPDEVESLIDKLKKNKEIRIYSKRHRTSAINSLLVYKEYLESNITEEADSIETDQGDVKIVNFSENENYSYTRPLSIEYSGRIYSVSNWTALYVQTVKCLLDDYPSEIWSLKGENIGGHGRVDIAGSDSSKEMIAPKELGGGLYLETNCSASGTINKIRQLMDYCNNDYSNIIIRYALKGSAVPSAEQKKTSDSQSSNEFLAWLTESEGLALPTGKSYSSAINNCDSFCREHNIGTGRIYGVVFSEELKQNIRLLLFNGEFQDYNNVQHHRFTAALSKYEKYMDLRDSGTLCARSAVVPENTAIKPEETQQIRKTLELPRFEYGFKDDSVELYRFRSSYADVNGEECTLSDEKLLFAIRGIGFEFDGKVYLVPEDEKERIRSSLANYMNQGLNIVYYESLYDLNADEYFEAKIISADMLKSLLKELTPNYHYKGNYLAFPPERQTELELVRNDIVRVWGNNALRTFDDLSMELPLIPLDKIKFTLAKQSDFIWNSYETYTRIGLFNADEDEIESLISYIDEQCTNVGSVSFDDLPLDTLRDNNPELSETALGNAFYKLIEDKYDRSNKVLTKKGTSRDVYTEVIEFCRKQDRCTYEQLKSIANRVAGVIRQSVIVEAANSAMVRVDKNNFVADRFVHFDVERIDTALNHIVVSGFVGMREITAFSIFPFCGYDWNLYLLESYCRRFSTKYRYDTRRANSSNSGAVIAKSCLLSYHDIMAYAVARSGRGLSENEVYDFLTETGYMERKRYSGIDSLINEAAELRERKK